jgi:uncharacterized protein YdeI (YjbR/CyaY-like superfamily)
MSAAAQEEPRLPFASAEAWRKWLDAEHARSNGISMLIAKKGSGIPSVTSAEAVEVALCFGWIDGKVGRVDDVHFLQRYTPRRARSVWSKRNRQKAEELIASGEMRPAGLAEVERAKADGRWDAAYDGQRTMEVPDDLRAALDASPAAAAFFESLDSHNRYAILYRTQDAKRPETRARRIAKFVAMLAAGERIHP